MPYIEQKGFLGLTRVFPYYVNYQGDINICRSQRSKKENTKDSMFKNIVVHMNGREV